MPQQLQHLRVELRTAMSLQAIDWSAAVDHAAPYLIEKLLKERIVDETAEAELLFREVKRYFVMAHEHPERSWQMHSLRVDEVWHQFILFTTEYEDYCRRFFGRYVHHVPSNAPVPDMAMRRPKASFREFRAQYERLFGEILPDVWYDARTLTPRRRLVNEQAGRQRVRGAERDETCLIAPNGEVLISVNRPAAEALAFIARTGAFYVRELPGGLTDAEKVELAAALVEDKILRASG
ncbi:glycine-rich domain-containing protein [Streptomyces goshikiensis]|uniref:glycine-rich domain-containing protein n=1 Tax=Streptomyces goshikiensis TaxID=1942 RepID=UPI0033BFA454